MSAIKLTLRFSKGSVDEPIVIDIFKRLQKLNREAINKFSSKEDYNLKKSLESYEQATYAFAKESAFREEGSRGQTSICRLGLCQVLNPMR